MLQGPCAIGEKLSADRCPKHELDPDYDVYQDPCRLTGERDGGPASDARAVFFDLRPFAAWANPPEIDDPHQLDVSSSYKLSFNGAASITVEAGGYVTDQAYDTTSNLTTAELIVETTAIRKSVKHSKPS